jgi:tRNA pseudouridine32 synthase/23S rRNA pseudouridine746 synthase
MDSKAGRITILYDDYCIIIVDKPSGLLSVPGRGPDKLDSVAQRIKALYPGCIAQPSVHRLDMATSGLTVMALTAESHRNISIQFQKRIVKKRYIALLDGILEKDEGQISLPFRLDPENRPYQIYDPVYGKVGITRWKKTGMEYGKTRVEFTPLTGRTHQLRIHSAHELGLNCPIIGDSLYGNGREGERMMLHASYLAFQHPVTGEFLEFESEPDF